MSIGFQIPPRAPGGNTQEHFRRHNMQLAESLAGAMGGKINAVLADPLTLEAGETSTTLTDSRIGVNSWVGLMPLTANAALAQQFLSIPAATVMKGSAVIEHNATREPWLNAQTDRTFRVLVIG
jgi:hypothetical protein